MQIFLTIECFICKASVSSTALYEYRGLVLVAGPQHSLALVSQALSARLRHKERAYLARDRPESCSLSFSLVRMPAYVLLLSAR